MPHSQTLPVMKESNATAKSVKALTPVKIETKSIPPETIEAEICLSPRWSDHGEKERRKEKKRQDREQREDVKRKKQEMEVHNAGKRLSKKPPAAMDTQKMPSELQRPRRNSFKSLISGQPSSQDESRRASKDEKRLSGASIASFMSRRRSKSEQRRPSIAPSEDDGKAVSVQSVEPWKPIVSPLAPKLPSFRWRPKAEPASVSKYFSLNGDQSSHEDFVAFAYQSDEPYVKKKIESGNLEDKTRLKEEQERHIVKDAVANDHTGNAIEIPANPSEQDTAPKVPHKDTKCRHNSASVQASRPPLKIVGSQNSNEPQNSDEAAAELVAMLEDERYKPHNTSLSPRSPQSHSMSSYDGGSYVHKQRMYQQQRYIAGFEEQEALQLFNEQAAVAPMDHVNGGFEAKPLNESSPPPHVDSKNRRSSSGSRDRSQTRGAQNSSRRQSTSPSKKHAAHHAMQVSPSPLKSVSHAPDNRNENCELQDHPALKRAGESISSNKTQSPQTGKPDKILGFRRRGKQAPTSIQTSELMPKAPTKVTSVDLGRPQEQDTVPKRSRIERMSAQIPFRHRRDSSTSQSCQPLDGHLENRGHSRTRTTSSQLANDHIISPIPISPATHAVIPGQRQSEPAKTKVKHDAEDTGRKAVSMNGSAAKNTVKPSVDLATLAASYTETISSPDSIEKVDNTKSHTNKEAKDPQLVVESANGEGIIRKTSITRPRSNPQLKTQPSAADSSPSVDFLPQLKHQPLVKAAKRSSTQQSAEPSPTKSRISNPSTSPSNAYKNPPVSPPDLALMPRSPLRQANRSAPSVTPFSQGKGLLAEGLDAKPIAKLFVICCKCKFWHDLPSKLYEAMALPKELHRQKNSSDKNGKGVNGRLVNGVGNSKGTLTLETAVKCPWCEHAMTTWCCAGWTTVVYLHERHH